MLRSIRKLLSRRGDGPRRDIFVYHDGTRERRADPLLLWDRIRLDPECDLAAVLPASGRGDAEAMRQLEAFVARVFEVERYDPETDQGLPVLDLHQLLARYMRYMEDLKKKRDLRPISSPPLGSSSSDPSTTRPTADSCSMPEESSAAVAT